MTDQRDKAIEEQASSVGASQADVQAGPMSRRALLRVAAIAAPTIVTMNSASATLAMTSVQTYTSTDAAQGDGRVYCLVEKSTLGPPPSGNPNALQVNSRSMPEVYSYKKNNRDYYTAKNTDSTYRVNAVDMCRNSNLNGTTYYFQKQGNWKSIKVKRGITMSAAAMGSIGCTAVKIDNF